MHVTDFDRNYTLAAAFPNALSETRIAMTGIEIRKPVPGPADQQRRDIAVANNEKRDQLDGRPSRSSER